AVAVREGAANPRRRARADVGASIPVEVAHADRAVVARAAPAARVRPARPVDAPIEARAVREPAAEAFAVARAEIVHAVAVHVGETQRRVEARLGPAV